ncbi:acyl-CoA dehydrogenase family protein [Phenylobacterium sp.]|uniref:acyl-CoA dehydrogenase family protein n=1 Tax=Phenylobacterium sp. TaxID=1871053 RepID=UPI00273346CC|nr:acyl-CoA dehydrogenase family protein [Phenylobacterium sp.]MDP3658617.1 acyl-CoA dehydrogenase family protein [Phenylobacterium sp.]
MNFSLDDDHRMLRDTARVFLEKEINLDPILKNPKSTVADSGYEANWQKIAELGWPGLVIPEEYGGSGMTPLDLVMIVQEIGRTVAPTPLLGALAGAWSLMKAGSESQKQKYLAALAAGETKMALAVSDANGEYDGPSSDAKATQAGSGYKINGSKSFVVDGGSADTLVVAAENGGKRGLFLVDAKQAGVDVKVLPWKDVTREVVNISFKDADAELLAADDADIWPWVRDRLLLTLAADSAGGLQRILEMSTEYAKERVAFGKPIGAYQSIKHGLADTFGTSEAASVGVLYAGWALSDDNEEGPIAAAMAKAYTSDAYSAATHQSIQIFGAIGFTWEMKNHLYFKRARSNAELFGGASAQRSRVLDMAVTRKAAA